MDSYYGYGEFESMAADESLIGLYVIFYSVAMAVSVVLYVLNALGYYTIAKRRQIRHPWMAWVPFCSTYLAGCVSDQYQQVAKRKTTKRRVILLVLHILLEVLAIIILIMSFSMLFSVIGEVMSGYIVDEDALLSQMIGTLFGILAVYMAMLGVAIAYCVFYYIAQYDLFASCSPDNKALYLLLSILLNVGPILVFVCRKRDDGMRPPVWMSGNWGQPQQPGQIPPAQEPWQ